jgi:predicted 2-oxoglutarate/Fe(II)-dependent dioxygenase YbiX
MQTTTRTEHLGDAIVTLRGLFSAAECDALVAHAEGLGFGDAPITTGRGFAMMPEVRNNTRAMDDDPARAEELWRRVRPFVRPRDGLREVGLNERLRFYRYAPGQFFRWHCDGAFRRRPGERSHVTAMVYLNDGFVGGATEFDVDGDVLRIVPERGLVLLFDHHLRHQGAPVRDGRKYVLRTDLMFADA